MGEWGISTPVDFISFGLNPIYFLEWWNVYIKQGEEREGCSPLSCSTMNNQHRETGVCQVRNTGQRPLSFWYSKHLYCEIWDSHSDAAEDNSYGLSCLVDWKIVTNVRRIFCLRFQVQVVQDASSSNHSNILNVINFLWISGELHRSVFLQCTFVTERTTLL